MRVLVLNCGSSSIKCAVLEADSGQRLLDLRYEGIGEPEALIRENGAARPTAAVADHALAFDALFEVLQQQGFEFEAVGHRVVHGGPDYSKPVLVDVGIVEALEALTALAPLHNAACVAGIRAALERLPALPQVVVFDTAFHATLPRRAQAYALPAELVAAHGIRRYGFHGISHEYVAGVAARHLQRPLKQLRLISCHLGNGSSVTAIENGRSVETSMGMTPLEGLVMGTRAGDVDAGVVLALLRDEGFSADDLDELLNRRSGLLGMAGVSNMQEVEARAAAGDDAARLALQVYCHRVRKYLGAYAALMDGVDAIVMTGGIGEHSAGVRHRALQRLGFLGAQLDEDRNADARVSLTDPVAEISATGSPVPLLVIATDEEALIARYTHDLLRPQDAEVPPHRTPVAVSMRHVHLNQQAIDRLFGQGHQLHPQRPLSQPGQYAAEETVALVGPRRTLENVRVLGPPRSECQVEISRSDEFYLGVDAPVRASGDTANTPGILLRGPAGDLRLEQGLICAWRHLHMAPADALAWGVEDGDLITVSVGAEHRQLQFQDVLVRVHPQFRLELHVDTDEGNAAELEPGAIGTLVAIERKG